MGFFGLTAQASLASVASPMFMLDDDAPMVSRDQVHQFKVLIFPHHGAYTQPQGRESVVSSVQIQSSKNCSLYSAQLNSKGEWEKSSTQPQSVNTSFKFTINTKAMLKGVWIGECESPFRVLRGGLKAYAYSGAFVVYQKGSHIEVMNQIDPEEYIKGVVPSEVGSDWPSEALKTQAVAARSYAWWSVLKRRGQGQSDYDMDDTVFYQAYLGLYQQNEQTITAVQSTTRQVLTYQGEVIQAYFSSDSGGHTEDASVVFGDRPYCIGKPEKYDITQQKSEWTKELSLHSVTLKLRQEKILQSSESISQIKIHEGHKSSSGRAIYLTLEVDQSKKMYLVEATKFRAWFGLRSTWIQQINYSKNQKNQTIVTLQGRGFGHGVGMSQWGTLQYVQQFGWTYDQILNHYYTDVTITQF